MARDKRLILLFLLILFLCLPGGELNAVNLSLNLSPPINISNHRLNDITPFPIPLDSSNFLILWQRDLEGKGHGIYGMVYPGGVGIDLSNYGKEEWGPRGAYNNGTCLIVWQEMATGKGI